MCGASANCRYLEQKHCRWELCMHPYFLLIRSLQNHSNQGFGADPESAGSGLFFGAWVRIFERSEPEPELISSCLNCSRSEPFFKKPWSQSQGRLFHISEAGTSLYKKSLEPEPCKIWPAKRPWLKYSVTQVDQFV